MGQLTDIATSPKTTGVITTLTTTSGLGTWLNFIPGDIGKLASLVGMFLSIVLIFYWIQKAVFEIKLNRLELERLRRENEKAAP